MTVAPFRAAGGAPKTGGVIPRDANGGAPTLTVLVEPDAAEARLLEFLLEEAGHPVQLAGGAAEAVRLALDGGADALILEAELGASDGYSLCQELRGRGFKAPVLFLSQRGERADKLKAFDSGADDFLVKPYDPQELLARLESAARRFRNADHDLMGRLLRVGDVELSVGELAVTVGRRRVFLSPTEARLLECLMRNSPITLSRDTLIDRAWPNDFASDTNRVDVYVARLRRKLERDSTRPEYIHTVRGMGYAFRPPAARVSELRIAGEDGLTAPGAAC